MENKNEGNVPETKEIKAGVLTRIGRWIDNKKANRKPMGTGAKVGLGGLAALGLGGLVYLGYSAFHSKDEVYEGSYVELPEANEEESQE